MITLIITSRGEAFGCEDAAVRMASAGEGLEVDAGPLELGFDLA